MLNPVYMPIQKEGVDAKPYGIVPAPRKEGLVRRKSGEAGCIGQYQKCITIGKVQLVRRIFDLIELFQPVIAVLSLRRVHLDIAADSGYGVTCAVIAVTALVQIEGTAGGIYLLILLDCARTDRRGGGQSFLAGRAFSSPGEEGVVVFSHQPVPPTVVPQKERRFPVAVS